MNSIIVSLLGFLNTLLILFLYFEIRRLRKEFNGEKLSIQEFKERLNELTEAITYLTKLSVDKYKNGKGKTVSFKPEDINKIKEYLNVSN
jgi:predicted Holliday junction resolvase-like endonuclease